MGENLMDMKNWRLLTEKKATNKPTLIASSSRKRFGRIYTKNLIVGNGIESFFLIFGFSTFSNFLQHIYSAFL